MLHLLFFLSGVSGLLYQVVWVREFGNVFGNTVYSSSLVVAIFMLGLGAGGYTVGVWADRRYARAPDSLLRAYGYVELVIAALALAVSTVLPRLNRLAALTSSYTRDANGWFVLSAMSYAARVTIAVVLLVPITMLMGGTLTLLIRYLVRRDVESEGGWKIARLYATNTAGAALGAFLTDFLLVPAAGLRATQIAGVALNLVAGAGALGLARIGGRVALPSPARVLHPTPRRKSAAIPESNPPPMDLAGAAARRAIVWTSLALAASGCAAMGMEIVWLRHFTLLLGGFRAVFSLVLTVLLIGIAAGSLIGGLIDRRTTRPADGLMVLQALLVVSALAGLGSASLAAVADGRAVDATLTALTPLQHWMRDLWFNVRPILVEIGLPSMVMGCSFPLANAVIQHAEHAVGRRAGALYLANTAGGVFGALATGFFLLPVAGLQKSATILMAIAGAAIVPVFLGSRGGRRGDLASSASADSHYRAGRPALGSARTVLAVSLAAAAIGVGAWMQLPGDYLLRRSIGGNRGGEHLLAVTEGVNEVIAVTEVPGRGRGLITNGHPMSSTAPLDQRYMRALAHIPLLSMTRPTRVLVIGFGVGNSTHAATLHPSVERVEVADLSRQVLEHAGYFRDANGGVLTNPRVAVYVNDGRQHLLMQPEGVYDLITLEPPPIAHAGVGALYSREFYALARARLKPGGYLSQWLPAYQVPADTTLAMVRAFIEAFPQSVLLSGMASELLLLGTNGDAIHIDPQHVAAALDAAPAVRADLDRLDLGTVTALAGTFVGSAATLARATEGRVAASDDRPLQEYVVRSRITQESSGVPASLFELSAVRAWCPACFEGEMPAARVPALDAYLMVLDLAYHARGAEAAPRAPEAASGRRRILGSAYLGAVAPDTDAVHNIVGVSLLRERRYDAAANAFREALKRRPDSAEANRNLGAALEASGRPAEAIEFLRRAVQLAPDDGGAQYELGSLLLERRLFAEAADCFRAALRSMPDSAAAHNNLGTAMASMGDVSEAIEQFRHAVALDGEFEEARHNLAAALQAARRGR